MIGHHLISDPSPIHSDGYFNEYSDLQNRIICTQLANACGLHLNSKSIPFKSLYRIVAWALATCNGSQVQNLTNEKSTYMCQFGAKPLPEQMMIHGSPTLNVLTDCRPSDPSPRCLWCCNHMNTFAVDSQHKGSVMQRSIVSLLLACRTLEQADEWPVKWDALALWHNPVYTEWAPVQKPDGIPTPDPPL